jgi:hypothetical protein
LLENADRFGLIARLEDGVVLPLQRMPQHGPERVLVFDEKNLRFQRSQPGGTPARRASSSISTMSLLAFSISEFTRPSSAIFF